LDFYAFSGHKMYGPTGIGVLYGKRELLESMPPWQFGGNMIDTVTFGKTTFNKIPNKFEAGTPNIAGAIGLSVAIEYLSRLGIENVFLHEVALAEYARGEMLKVPKLKLIGTSGAGVLSFIISGISNEEIGAALDAEGIAIRTGAHCAMPIVHSYGVEGVARASLGVYNVQSDIDRFVSVLQRVVARS